MTTTFHAPGARARRRGLAVAALALIALPLAACGDDVAPVVPPGPDAGANAASPAPQDGALGDNIAAMPKADAATVSWAEKLCGVVADHTRNVEPPAINPDDPSATVKAFATMFGSMEKLMREQRAGLAGIGEPPTHLRAPYADALGRFDKAQALLGDAQERLAGVSPDNPQELVEALKSVGDLKVGDKVYPGLVPDLATLAPTFSRAVPEAKACSAVPGV